MATDYILFIHGVNTRERREEPEFADKLFGLIEKSVEPPLKVEKVALYWGDVNIEAEEQLTDQLINSAAWKQLWFKDFREKQLLQFVGDAALYLSRHVGAKVISKLKLDAEKLLGRYQRGDRLHLVTHSWGTVILFDVLFADRWEKEDIPLEDRQNVMDIRRLLFGLEPKREEGIRLSSIHTMGSPIALFSLISVNGSTHDFKPRLNQLLQALLNETHKKLPWLNFIHPGDPVAWPFENVMFNLVDRQAELLNFEDVITHNTDLSDFITQPLSQTILALLHGGDAHGSYWTSKQVTNRIAEKIKQVANE